MPFLQAITDCLKELYNGYELWNVPIIGDIVMAILDILCPLEGVYC